jgi:hypothetical protein
MDGSFILDMRLMLHCSVGEAFDGSSQGKRADQVGGDRIEMERNKSKNQK